MSFHYRRNRRREDHHLDDWLMTYADMITLILCFFAVFLSISIPKKEALHQMRSQVMEKFATDSTAQKTSTTIAQEMPNPVSVKTAPSSDFPIILGNLKDESPSKVKTGDRISSIDMNSASFFSVGSATLRDEGKNILDTVLDTAKSDKFRDYKITIEGHTDDVPINTLQFPSNWELSTARAAAVARYFLEQGIKPQRLRASGYADTFPKVPNRDAMGKSLPENQAQNRRVVIKLEKTEKDN